MVEIDPVEALISTLTPTLLLDKLRFFSRQQPKDLQDTVPLHQLLDDLLAGLEFATPQLAWAAQMRLRQALVGRLADVPGVRYFEGDS